MFSLSKVRNTFLEVDVEEQAKSDTPGTKH
jgi:hypothetical protein